MSPSPAAPSILVLCLNLSSPGCLSSRSGCLPPPPSLCVRLKISTHESQALGFPSRDSRSIIAHPSSRGMAPDDSRAAEALGKMKSASDARSGSTALSTIVVPPSLAAEPPPPVAEKRRGAEGDKALKKRSRMATSGQLAGATGDIDEGSDQKREGVDRGQGGSRARLLRS
ncbi:hypothetical protein GW17_00015805 [Ensete ventricosum]|nr:hypothetical protein GW17_00015805 [Ensete ventricosum]